jgi:hypothetical protein
MIGGIDFSSLASKARYIKMEVNEEKAKCMLMWFTALVIISGIGIILIGVLDMVGMVNLAAALPVLLIFVVLGSSASLAVVATLILDSPKRK